MGKIHILLGTISYLTILFVTYLLDFKPLVFDDLNKSVIAHYLVLVLISIMFMPLSYKRYIRYNITDEIKDTSSDKRFDAHVCGLNYSVTYRHNDRFAHVQYISKGFFKDVTNYVVYILALPIIELAHIIIFLHILTKLHLRKVHKIEVPCGKL